MSTFKLTIGLMVGLGLAGAGSRAAGPAASFLRPGDRWVLVGDSITHYDLYRQQVARVLDHFRPGHGIVIFGGGIPDGSSAARQEVADKAPTIVSIMLGMNNYINSSLRYGQQIAPAVNAYRADLAAKIANCRQAGAVVLLFSPTLVDERFEHGVYELRGGTAFLRECARVAQELAEADADVYYLPVQEEFEALEARLGRGQILRHDGVHPSALGQYQIARTLWERLGVANPPGTGERALATPPTRVPVGVALQQRRLAKPEIPPALVLTAAEPIAVTATWSLRQTRGQAVLELPVGDTVWRPEIPAAALHFAPGQQETLVLDLAAAERRSVYLLDFSCVPVVPLVDGTASGTIPARGERPEGQPPGTWKVARHGHGMIFSGEVVDSEIRADGFWPWERDGVNLYLDLRPDDRQGNIGFDEEVHIAILAPHTQPAFGSNLIPWVGRGMHLAADSGMQRTDSGYRWHLHIHRYFTKPTPVDFTTRQAIGFNLVLPDRDTVDGKPRTEYHRAWEFTPYVDKYPNLLPLIDLSGQETATEVVRLHLFGD